MLIRNHVFKIKDIYVPTKRRETLDPDVVASIAESMLEEGQLTPIWVREDGKRYVLVEGLHRLEACKALGDETIVCMLVQARKK
ncbi:MAG: ParB N-terminal domain-containing protein [Rhodospirillales bacterium]|nr:ParB N-terminal domain-containing protein [Rhodospirillales bacterium]